MMRRLTILACLCVLPALAGLAKAAIAPATSGEAIGFVGRREGVAALAIATLDG